MELSKRQAEFWGSLIAICVVVGIAVLLLDFGIKAAILEESTALRLKIEAWEVANGRGTKGPNQSRAGDDATVKPSLPSGLLVDNPTGMEEGESANGGKAPTPTTRKSRNKPSA